MGSIAGSSNLDSAKTQAPAERIGGGFAFSRIPFDLVPNRPTLANEHARKRGFLLADPRCLVIVGNTAQLDSPAKQNSFEYFRGAQRTTEIITFDELFKKVSTLCRSWKGIAISVAT